MDENNIVDINKYRGEGQNKPEEPGLLPTETGKPVADFGVERRKQMQRELDEVLERISAISKTTSELLIISNENVDFNAPEAAQSWHEYAELNKELNELILRRNRLQQELAGQK